MTLDVIGELLGRRVAVRPLLRERLENDGVELAPDRPSERGG